MISRRNILLAAFLPAHRDMARLPGGTFQMGSDETTLSRQFPTAGAGLKSMLLAETPAHQVTIPSFFMDRHEITNLQFQKFLRARPNWSKERIGGDYLRHWNANQFPSDRANHPVVFVSWDAAVAYAE